MQKTKRSVYNPDNYRKFQVFTEFEEDDLIDPDSLDEYRHFKQESSYILGIRKFTMEEEFSLRNQYPIVTQTNRGDLKVLSWESFEDYRTFVYSPQNKKPVIVPFRIDNSIYKFDYEFNFLSPRINKKVRDATYTIFACTLASEGINDIRFGDEFFIRQGIKWLEYYDNMGHLITREEHKINLKKKEDEKLNIARGEGLLYDKEEGESKEEEEKEEQPY